ncbi:hypothetical protein [Edaphobacter aggregans]|uniref:hypothetical protein n=1 Tax=Edaphobacter aggregans TaxID=570835 RepID=UPI0012F9427C|nr:hypothetical protein [Edaphobacter aggregans]
MKQTSEIVESVVQYASVWKLLVNELPNADLADRPGLSISWADNPFLSGMLSSLPSNSRIRTYWRLA